jgi:hypothetical protein
MHSGAWALPVLPVMTPRTTFMRRFAKTSTIILAGAITMSAVALADPAASVDATKAAETPAVTTGSIDLDPPAAQRMADCMAIWEPRTHMTKKEWRRTCKTTLQEFAVP